MNRMYFDNLDLSILTSLSTNARTPYLEIARDNGVSGAAVHQRVQRLMAKKVINGSHCNIEPSAVGFTVVAYLGINALPGTDVENLAVAKSKKSPSAISFRDASTLLQNFTPATTTTCSQSYANVHASWRLHRPRQWSRSERLLYAQYRYQMTDKQQINII